VSHDISEELRRNHEVDEYFYPNISMDIDLPQGLKGEITGVKMILEKNGFAGNSENIFRIMSLKKDLLSEYCQETRGRKVVREYSVVVRKNEPVGSIVPLDYLFVGGLIVVLLYGLKRFIGSFADESGKLLARRLFGQSKTRKELMKELSVSVNEYKILNNEIIVFIERNAESLDTLRKKLKKAN
jgi:hypothetical protein